MKEILNYLSSGYVLSANEAKSVMTDILAKKYEDVQVASFLTSYAIRVPTVEEFKGFRNAIVELTPAIRTNQDVLDIVGTGGDGKNTFNISTLAALVSAGAGVPVAKFGNYSATSVSGSSDVLENLGVQLAKNKTTIQQQLDTVGISFLHAPNFYPTLKNVADVRKTLQIQTVFNLLGPLMNPVNPMYKFLGVSKPEIGALYKSYLAKEDYRYTIIQSLDGYDEISLTSDFYLWDKRIKVQTEKFNKFIPSKLKQEDIEGGKTITENARIFMNVLKGKATDAQHQVVLANAAWAISFGNDCSLNAGIELAKESLFGGKALKCFEMLK